MLPHNSGFGSPSSNFPLDAFQKQLTALTEVAANRNTRSSGENSGETVGRTMNYFQNQATPGSLERSSMQKPPPNVKDRVQGFLISLASFFAKRNQPLPPGLTGITPPNYDPVNSAFKDIEPGSEPGSFKVAGKDINIFQLWSMVWQRGGLVNLTKDNTGWQAIIQNFDIPEPALTTIFQIYSRILLPFENLYRQNILDQQKKAHAMRQAGASAPPANGQHPPTSTSAMPSQRGFLPSSQPSSSSVPPLPMQDNPQNDGANTILDGPTLDQDLQGLKRKLEQEEEGKRTRQKTETVDNVFPAGSASDQAFVGPTNTNPGPNNPTTQAPTNAAMNTPSRTRQELSRRKIEYKPLVREIETYGGRDLKAIETEVLNSLRRPLRDLNDWGTIDVDALTLSIRSKLSTELSYALTTLTLLSTMKGQSPTAGFPINNCPDLMEEVLDLLEDLAFGEVQDIPETINLQDDSHIVTNREVVDIIYESESQPFAVLERRRGFKEADISPRQRPANLILTITNIIRNLAVFADNVPFMANHPRLLDLLLRVCGISKKRSSYHATCSALGLADVLAVRRDVLNILCLFAPFMQFSEATPLTTIRRIFHLIASYLVDPAEAVSPLASVQLAGVPLGGNLKPPALADIALEVFTRLGHSDGNRLLFSKTVSRPALWCIFVSLVHRLPLLDVDFQLSLRGEIWLSYLQKLVMALYTLAFIFPPELKAKVKADRSLGFKNVLMRMIQKLFVQNNPESRQYFAIIVRRIIETLKLIDDEGDSFDNGKDVVSTLSFGMGYGEVGENDFERGTGMLGGYTDMGWDILLCREVQLDDVMFSELESLIRVEY